MRSDILGIAIGTVAAFTLLGTVTASASCPYPEGCAAPRPITDETFLNSMYLRGSVGYGVGSKPDVSIEGWSVDGLTRNGSIATSFGFGGWITPEWRAEVSVSPIFNSRIEYNAPSANVNGTIYSGGVRNASTIIPIMFDVYRDFDTKTPFRPYVGAGVGAAFSWSDLSANLSGGGTNIEYKVASSTSVGFAAAAMAGVAYDVSRNVSIDLGYKYLYVDQIQTKKDIAGYALTATSRQNSFNQFFLGARYRFE